MHYENTVSPQTMARRDRLNEMSLQSLDYTYRYTHPSDIEDSNPNEPYLRLATSSIDSHPQFLDATLVDPVTFAESMLCLASIVRTHYFLPKAGLLDPVVTFGEGALRFEGFSGCVGVYVQAVFQESGFREPFAGRGTTNIDINDPLRNSLARVRASQNVRLSIGAQQVAVHVDHQEYIEKKVKLPLRWIRGFCEVQAYLSKATRVTSMPVNQLLQFIRDLPRNAARTEPIWAVSTGKSLRLTSRKSNSAIRISGTERLRSIEPLLRHGRGEATVWSDLESGVSVWCLDLTTCQFQIALSPELYRGFSGEGQVLSALASETWQNAFDQVKSYLNWQGSIDPNTLSTKFGLPKHEICGALDALATRGLVGFDLSNGCYYHRELPFRLDLVESLQPRLLAARKLVKEDAVHQHKVISDSQSEWLVQGSGTQHLVLLSDDRDRCTCVWYSKHQGERGPCKHVLAARMKQEGETPCQP